MHFKAALIDHTFITMIRCELTTSRFPSNMAYNAHQLVRLQVHVH